MKTIEKGKKVVLSGGFPELGNRKEIKEFLELRGITVQDKVSSTTDILLVGEYLKRGKKLEHKKIKAIEDKGTLCFTDETAINLIKSTISQPIKKAKSDKVKDLPHNPKMEMK